MIDALNELSSTTVGSAISGFTGGFLSRNSLLIDLAILPTLEANGRNYGAIHQQQSLDDDGSTYNFIDFPNQLFST